MTPEEAARNAFAKLAREYGSHPVAEEEAILSIDRAYLPPCAIAVLEGGEPTVEYWEFLTDQTKQVQDEHDREIAAGHEWHR